MKKKINLCAVLLALLAAAALVAVCCGATHQFFTFLTAGGLAYAIATETETESTNK